MWQFIVSGYIPGTNFQVTFVLFQLVVGIAVIVYLLYVLLKQNGQLKQNTSDTALTIKNIGVISVNKLAALRIL